MPEGHQLETVRVGHSTSTQSECICPSSPNPGKTLFSQMPALRLRPKTHSSFAGYTSKPLQAGKHQNPVHGLSKLKLLLGFSSRQTPANPCTNKVFIALASPSRPGFARISSTPRSLWSLRPFPATLYFFSSTPPPSAGKSSSLLFGFLLGPSRTGT